MRIALLATLAWSTLTIGVGGRWASSVFECAAFVLLLAVSICMAQARSVVSVNAVAMTLSFVPMFGLFQIAFGFSIAPWETGNAVMRWSALVALCWATPYVLQASSWTAGSRRSSRGHPASPFWFLRAFAIFANALAVACLLQPALHLPGYDHFAGPFQNRNTYAAFIELALPVTAWVASRDKQREPLWWTAAAVMVASVITTGARAGAILVVAEFAILLAITRRGRLVAGAGLLAMLWVSVAGWETLAWRAQLADPFAERGEVLRAGWKMAAERPLLGFGLGSFQDAYPRFASVDIGRLVNHVHNDWLEWLIEGGLAMPALLGAALALVIPSLTRSWWAGGILAVAVHALIDYPFARSGLAAWVWVLAAIAVTPPIAVPAPEARESVRRSGRSLARATR